jgi:hypothetical protein
VLPREPVRVQTPVAEAAVEALDTALLHHGPQATQHVPGLLQQGESLARGLGPAGGRNSAQVEQILRFPDAQYAASICFTSSLNIGKCVNAIRGPEVPTGSIGAGIFGGCSSGGNHRRQKRHKGKLQGDRPTSRAM